jgi:hypothetical protein
MSISINHINLQSFIKIFGLKLIFISVPFTIFGSGYEFGLKSDMLIFLPNDIISQKDSLLVFPLHSVFPFFQYIIKKLINLLWISPN